MDLQRTKARDSTFASETLSMSLRVLMKGLVACMWIKKKLVKKLRDTFVYTAIGSNASVKEHEITLSVNQKHVTDICRLAGNLPHSEIRHSTVCNVRRLKRTKLNWAKPHLPEKLTWLCQTFPINPDLLGDPQSSAIIYFKETIHEKEIWMMFKRLAFYIFRDELSV